MAPGEFLDHGKHMLPDLGIMKLKQAKAHVRLGMALMPGSVPLVAKNPNQMDHN